MRFLLKNYKKVVITFLKIDQTKLGFLIPIFDYNLFTYNHEKVLKNYLKLLTLYVNLTLTDFQHFTKCY